MEVILIQDLANLGFKNDIVKVRDGYGRNYLLPNKIAVIANESNRNIPTIVFMKDGKVQDKIVGAASKSKIDEKIKALL